MLRGAALVLALGAVGMAWSLSSPVGSSPDDDFHLASIWCSAWAPKDTCVPTDAPVFTEIHAVLVPEVVSEAAICYRKHPWHAGSCPLSGDPTALSRSRANSGEYPGGYYDLLGLLVTDRPLMSVLLMRMASWICGIGLIALAAFVAPPRLRRAYLAGVVATCVPLGMFVLASTNPSGLAFASVPAAWCAAMAYFDATTPSRRAATASVTGLAVLAALITRVDAGVYVAACAAVVLTLNPISRRTAQAILASVLIVVAAITVSGHLNRVLTGFGEPFDRPLGDVLWSNLLNLPLLWTGSLGTSKLGWLDTQMPGTVSMVMVAVVVALLALGIRDLDRRKTVALAVLGSVFVAYPMYFLTASRSLVGENFQPRYLLPLLPVAVGVALLPTNRPMGPTVTRRLLVALGVGLSVAHSAALHSQIRRYVTGDDVLDIDLTKGAEWWWRSGPSPMGVWFLGTVAFAAAVAMIGHRWVLPATDRATDDDPTAPGAGHFLTGP